MFKAHHRHYLAGFLLDLGVMIGMTAMPFYVMNQIGGGAQMIGIIGGAQAIGYALACLVQASGLLPQMRSGLQMAAIATGVYAVAFCGAVLTRNPVLYGVLNTVGMSSLAFVWPSLHAWIGAEPNLRRRGRRMARFNIAWALGFTVGPLVGGPLYVAGYWYPFAAVFVLCMVVIAMFLVTPDERRYFGVSTDSMVEARAGHDRASEAHLVAAWTANAVGNAMSLVARTIFAKRVEELVSSNQLRLLFESAPPDFLTGEAATKFMWITFAVAAGNAFTFFAMGRTNRWHHRFSVLAGLQLAAALGILLMGVTDSLLLMLAGCAAVGAAWGGCFFAGVFYSVANPEKKHGRAAINEGAVGLGGFLGAVAFGFTAEQYGIVTPFLFTPLVVGLAIAVQYLLVRRSHVTGEPSAAMGD